MTDRPDPCERIDPTNIRRWRCTAYNIHTIVLATNREEAKAIAMYWFTKARPLWHGRVNAREATDDDVQRWLDTHAQQTVVDQQIAELKEQGR